MNRHKQHSHLEVHVTRGQTLESCHLVDAVIVDSKGKLVEVFGQKEGLVFPRSSIKMLQALSLVESGAVEKWGLSKAHIAAASSSHWGDEQHTDLVSAWLTQLGLSQDALVCGAHDPIDERSKNNLIRQNLKPSRLHNNCSGKHTGLICAAMQRKESYKHYERWDHSTQIRLRRVMTELSGTNLDQAPWGVDGCGIPTYAMPLEAIACAFSALLIDRDFSSDRKLALGKVRESVLAEPHYIAGTGAFCTEVIRAAKGKAIVKTGAEGVYCGASLESGFAFALKARDGAGRASEVATAALLRKLGGLSDEEFSHLSQWTSPLIKNWEGQIVGKRFVPESHFA